MLLSLCSAQQTMESMSETFEPDFIKSDPKLAGIVDQNCEKVLENQKFGFAKCAIHDKNIEFYNIKKSVYACSSCLIEKKLDLETTILSDAMDIVKYADFLIGHLEKMQDSITKSLFLLKAISSQ